MIVARTLPQFAFGVFAGVAIDWFDRKRVLQLSQLAAFALNVGFAALLLAACFGALLILFALSTYLPGALGRGWIALPLALVFAAGLFQSGVFALVQVMVLDAAPDRMRGRLMGLLAFDRATMMAGAAGGGLLAEAVGVQPAQILYALLVIAGALAVLALSPGFRAAAVGAAPRPPR